MNAVADASILYMNIKKQYPCVCTFPNCHLVVRTNDKNVANLPLYCASARHDRAAATE